MFRYLDYQPVKVNNSTVKTIATLKTIATVKTIAVLQENEVYP